MPDSGMLSWAMSHHSHCNKMHTRFGSANLVRPHPALFMEVQASDLFQVLHCYFMILMTALVSSAFRLQRKVFIGTGRGEALGDAASE